MLGCEEFSQVVMTLPAKYLIVTEVKIKKAHENTPRKRTKKLHVVEF